MYELVKCNVIKPGSEIWAKISIGTYSTEKPIVAKYKEKSRSYKWKEVKVDSLENMELPHDLS